MTELPAGRVAFLFTDLEGSTRFWEAFPREMPAVYAQHDAILRQAAADHHGVAYKVIGDAFQIAFPTSNGALLAAITAQRDLFAAEWPLHPAPRVRMALHLVDVAPDAAGDYRTPGLNRLGRLLSAADGGQILLSEAFAQDPELQQIADVDVRNLGEYRVRDLSAQRIFQALASGLPNELAILRTLAYHQHNLPTPASSFLGRSSEIAQANAWLADSAHRVLTLTGPGGVGKTRLSIAVGQATLERFADGVWFVPLAAAENAAQMMAAIAAAIGASEVAYASSAVAVAAHLSERQALLILDNLEQIPDVAPALSSLLRAAPRLTILATSRRPLALTGEQEIPVRPLSTGDAGAGEAVSLFVERVRAMQPNFLATPQDLTTIAAICAHLDGLPLAIELAASRCRLLPPAALLQRLRERLPLLVGGPRDAPARQQTMRAAIDWSYCLLSEGEQSVFAQLAVFANGASISAVEMICGASPHATTFDVLHDVESLARHSLISIEDAAGWPRVRMLETIREYAQERLAASDTASNLAQRHADFYLAVANDAEPRLSGPDQIEWLDALAQDGDNLRAAAAWFLAQGDAAKLADLAGALGRYWWIRGQFHEGRAWLKKAVELAAQDAVSDKLFARVHDGAGVLAEAQGDIDAAIAHHEAALALWQRAGDRLGEARTLQNLGIIALHDRGEPDRARTLHEAAFAHYQAGQDQAGMGTSLKNLGDIAMMQEEFAAAASYYDQALRIARRLRDTRNEVTITTSQGVLAFLSGEFALAASLLEESLPTWRALHDLPGIALTLGNLGEAHDHLGSPEQARPLFLESLKICTELGDQQGIAFAQVHLGRVDRQSGNLAAAAKCYADAADLSLTIEDYPRLAESVEGLAGVLGDSGELEAAARLLGLAAALREQEHAPLPSVHRVALARDLQHTNSCLGEAAFARLFAEGQRQVDRYLSAGADLAPPLLLP